MKKHFAAVNSVKDKGFTLVELTVILLVIGVLITLGVSLMGPLTKRIKINQTNDIIDAAAESLISYASSNKRLPTTTEFSIAVRNPNDAWTKSLFYVTDTNLTVITAPAIEAVCGRSTTNLTVQTCPDATCASPTNTIPNVAFIIISGGANNNNQTAGTQAVSSATTISVYDVDVAGIDNYSGDIGGARPEPYDDLVKWTTLNELRTKSGCASSPLSIQTTTLASGFRCGVYSATVYAEGGVPYSSGGSYKWCTQGTLPGGITLTPNVTSANCSALAEASWGQADNLTLTASAAALYPTGTFSLTFFVRDNNDASGTSDNIAQKAMPLVIKEYGNMIRIWNETGATYDFLLDGSCRDSIATGDEISQFSQGFLLRPDQSCDRYADATGCTVSSGQSVTYDQAIAVDTDCGYQVNFTLAGVANR